MYVLYSDLGIYMKTNKHKTKTTIILLACAFLPSVLLSETKVTAYFLNDSINGFKISDAYETHNMGILWEKDKNIERELVSYGCFCIKTSIDGRDIQLKRYKIFFIKSKRIGILTDDKLYANFDSSIQKQFESVVQVFVDLGLQIESIKLPKELRQAHKCHEVIYSKCLSYYFREEWARCKDQFSEILSNMIIFLLL